MLVNVALVHVCTVDKYDLSSILQFIKYKLISPKKNIVFVGISEWLTETAKKSKILSGHDISTISNTSDISSFSPLHPSKCRKSLGLPLNKKIILFGAINSDQEYKGSIILKKFLSSLDSSNIALVSFGQTNFNHICPHIINFGKISSRILLNEIYASADLFVFPSIQEAFGKTVIESLASGTPVVCFPNTGASSMITHNENGIVCERSESDSLITASKHALSIDLKNHYLSTNIDKFLSPYHEEAISKLYVQLYKSLLNT